MSPPKTNVIKALVTNPTTIARMILFLKSGRSIDFASTFVKTIIPPKDAEIPALRKYISGSD